MSKCELLPKGCDCGSTEAAKCQQEKPKMPEVGQMVLIKKILHQGGVLIFKGEHLATVTEIQSATSFVFTPKCTDAEEEICDSSDGDIWELTDKKPMKSREEIEQAITVMQAEIETGLDLFMESYYETKIDALKWCLNEI